MQIKKFEALSIQEALEAIKRELGPEAIILQTKRNRKGFGLMGGTSVEVTAAISDRSLTKRAFAERRISEDEKEVLRSLPAARQAEILERSMERAQSRKGRTDAIQIPKKLTERRYVDIDPQDVPVPKTARASTASSASADRFTAKAANLEDEVKHLKRMIEELKIAQEEAGSAGGTFASQLQ